MQVHTVKKACAAVYPSTVQHDIVWFWPNSDPQYKEILVKKKPPFIPELDDPSYTKLMGNRDINYGYSLPLSSDKNLLSWEIETPFFSTHVTISDLFSAICEELLGTCNFEGKIINTF
jgi:hypothetical protein